jgi:hypothetical protein
VTTDDRLLRKVREHREQMQVDVYDRMNCRSTRRWRINEQVGVNVSV